VKQYIKLQHQLHNGHSRNHQAFKTIRANVDKRLCLIMIIEVHISET